MTLGNKLLNLRKEKNISQEQLAYDLEVSKTTIINWENDYDMPKTKNMLRICEYFDIELSDLISVEKVDLSNSTFDGANYVVNPNNTTINYSNSPEILEILIENNKKIFELLELNTKIMENLVK